MKGLAHETMTIEVIIFQRYFVCISIIMYVHVHIIAGNRDSVPIRRVSITSEKRLQCKTFMSSWLH